MDVRRLGVALTAAVAAVLVFVQPAFSQEAPPPAPADTTTTTTSTEPATTATAPPAGTTTTTTTTTTTESAPAAADEPAGDSSTAPPAGSADTSTATSGTSTAADTSATPKPAPEDVVKLEGEAPTESTTAPSASAAPAPAPAPAPPAAAPPSGAPPQVTIVLVQSPAPPAPAAAPPAAAETAAPATVAETTAAEVTPIVSFRPPDPISLLPHDAQAAAAPTLDAPAARAPKKLKRVARTIVGQSCAQPRALVPLSQRCQQAQAVAVLRVTFNSAPSPEVRAAIERVTAPAAARRVQARPPPESKAAKKRPVAELRPTIPFGSSGQGATNDGFNGSSGSTWSSRVFALAAVPLRVPWPLRFAQLVLPSTIPHGVIAAPPTARPG